MEQVLSRGYDPMRIEKFLMELAWRDYWQQVWVERGNEIDHDLKRSQPGVRCTGVPKALIQVQTGVDGIDEGIHQLYASGYMHNHVRMYTAAVTCSISGYHWRDPAKWMYYHLLDGDWGSNALSWQWVSGANAGKQYVANQENVNKYTGSNQKGSWLDVTYEELVKLKTPDHFIDKTPFTLKTPLPSTPPFSINENWPTVVYTSYHLDPAWLSGIEANRVLIMEPSHFQNYPISHHVISFVIELATFNIPGIQIFVGEFEDLKTNLVGTSKQIHYKEHPFSRHFTGVQHDRDWMFSVRGYYPSFFAFWNKCKKELKL
jgi:deoxyribodipyrimidine photo-lyase